MPSDLTQVVSSLGVAGETLGIRDVTPIDKTAKPQPAQKPDPCIDADTSKGGREDSRTTQAINRDVQRQDRDE